MGRHDDARQPGLRALLLALAAMAATSLLVLLAVLHP
jgi:hypothetical protein